MSDFYELTPEQQEPRYLELAKSVLPLWGLEGASLDIIKVRENAVFRVDTTDATKLVLRIHRANYHTNEELHSELQWIRALSEAGIETPEVIPTLAGELSVVPDTDVVGLPRQVDVFAWVDGEQLGRVEEGLDGDLETQVRSFETIGELAARVHNQATSWELPNGFVRHAWDTDGLTGEEPFWGRFWELEALSPAQKDLMIRTRQRIREELLAFGQSAENYSMIHADMVGENVLVDGEHIRLIDFDDAGFGWHLFEMATSLYFATAEGNYESIRDAFVKGYRKQRTLSESDLEKLPLFMLARATTYLGWVHTRKETETAKELTPFIVELCCANAEEYLSS